MVLTGGTEVLGGQTCHSATLCTINLTWTGLGSNPSLRGERLATNLLLKFAGADSAAGQWHWCTASHVLRESPTH